MAEVFVQGFIAGLMAIYGLVYLIGGIEAAQVHTRSGLSRVSERRCCVSIGK